MSRTSRAERAVMPVIVTNDFPPSHGGIQRVMSLLAHELAARNQNVIVVAPKVAGSDAYDAKVKFQVMRYGGSNRAVSTLSMVACTLLAQLRSRDALTIASMWFPGGLAACLVPRVLRGRLAILAHGSEIAPRKAGLRRLILRYVFGRADFILANSGFTRDLLVNAGVTAGIRVVYPGVDAIPIAPDRAAIPTILSVGRLIPRKGFDAMIGALPEILEHFPSTRYEIVGAGPQQAELEALATRLGIGANVVFLGSVSDEQVRAAYARAWIFALPVRSIDNDVEGFGLVYLEAALAELPTVGGRDSGAEDAIVPGETGLLVDGTSKAEIARAVTTLFADPDGARRMGIAGRDRVLANFSPQRWVDALENVFHEQVAEC